MEEKTERYCGNCCWFTHEDTYGCGICMREYPDHMPTCDKQCTNGEYVSREQMRHYMAVLIKANRYRRDQHVPAWHRMPHPTELGKAIDFAVQYMKVFSSI